MMELTLKIKVNMKKVFGLLMMLFSLNLFAVPAAQEVQEEKGALDVRLKKGNVTNDDTHPRTFIPITCVYTDGMVQLSLLGEVGEFTLTVINQLTGERWSAENTLMLYTSTANGIYWVQIVTEDGIMYYGTYVLQ